MARTRKIRSVVYKLNFKIRQWIRFLAKEIGPLEALEPQDYDHISRRVEQRYGLILFNDDVKAILYSRRCHEKRLPRFRRRIIHAA